MKKVLLCFIALFALCEFSSAQAVMPSYDKAKHYQLRSMETGPWKFHPPGWYYSWWTKEGKILWWDVKWRLPGLGIHDNGPAGIGGGDKYVTRYSPNKTRRALMLVQANLSKKKYEAMTTSISEIHKRELLNIADRSIDIVYNDYEEIFNKLHSLMYRKLIEYRRMVGLDETLQILIIEHRKIVESVTYMKKSYVKNVDRQKVYIAQMKKLEELILKCNKLLETHHIFNTLNELKCNV